MASGEGEIDIFKVLGHPARREILIFIAKNDGATYKDLLKIVPKPGALYHHLRLLGDLIYQDDKKAYHLTSKGRRVYEFLISEFFVPKDESLHRYLTPRTFLELLEGIPGYCCLIMFIVSGLFWLINKEIIPVFLLVFPFHKEIVSNIILVYLNFLVFALIIKIVARILYGRSIDLLDLLIKQSPAYILINLYPFVFLIQDEIIFSIVYIVLHLFVLLFMISAVSVTTRMSLKAALTIVIVIHYSTLLLLVITTGGIPGI